MRRFPTAALACLFVVAACAHAAAAQQQSRKFDEFGDICCDDEKARLDNFANELRVNPDTVGFIIFYGGRRHRYPYCYGEQLLTPRRGEAAARAARLKPFMMAVRGVPSERLIVVNGGYREEWSAEFWIVPKGTPPPRPTPTLRPEEIKFRRGRPRRRDYVCDV